MSKIYIDLETIKCQKPELIEFIKSLVKPHHSCKTEESKEKSVLKQMGDVVEKTVFDGAYGEIVTIGYAIDNEPEQVLQRTDSVNERDVIQAFFDALAKNAPRPERWVAHNKEFDLRFLWQRSIINQIEMHGIKIPVNERHGRQAFCTMQEWKGFGAKPGGSLDSLCKVLGLDGKGDFTGADVYDAWSNGQYQKIADYCKHDVYLLREVYRRLTKEHGAKHD
jgi:predicted PolB exonuclease-like 3'-5' exonuclease